MRALFTILLALVVTTAWAQLDRSQPPKPSAAKEIKIADYEKFELKNGLKIIVVENNKLPTIGWTLTLDTGPITEGDRAGYTSMFGQVLRAGTTSKTKEVLDEEIDFIGASVNAGSSSISAFSLSKYKEDVLDFMSDVLLNPIFPEEELEKAKKQMVSSLASAKDDPNTISSNVSSVVNYGKDHVFGEIVTEETVDNVTMEDLKNHYANYFKPNIATLVVVGDISKREAQKLAKKYFSSWEKGDVNRESFENPENPEKTTISFVDRSTSVQSVIDITYPIDNKPGNSDATKIALLNQILGGSGGRLFNNLREDKGYTYGAYSSAGGSRYSATFSASASVRNEVTDSTMVEFMYELDRIKTEPVGQEELDIAKNYLRGSFARSLESRNTVASFALTTQLNNLPDDYYANYLKRLEAITAADIQEVANKYIRPDKANVVVVGKADEVAEKLRRFGEIKYYDEEGNPVADPTKAVVSDITPKQIIDKYIEAVGGLAAVEAVTSVENKSKASIQGIELSRTVYQIAPDKYADIQNIPGQGEVKQIYTGGSAHVVMAGQRQDMPPNFSVLFKYLGVMWGERFYTEMGFTTEYKGLKKVNGQDAHRIDVNLGNGMTISEFYDVASGLKVRMEIGQQVGNIELGDYKEVNGVKIYHSFKQSGGALPVTLEYISEEVIVNGTIDETIFN